MYRSAFASVLLLSSACYTLFPDRARPVLVESSSSRVLLASSAPDGVLLVQRCAIQLADALRKKGSFAAELRASEFEMRGVEPEARHAVVSECLSRRIELEWRVRRLPWLPFFPFVREVGSTQMEQPGWCGRDAPGKWCVRSYENAFVSISNATAHILHEHLHTCGDQFDDGNGDQGSTPTYVIGRIVTKLLEEQGDNELLERGCALPE